MKEINNKHRILILGASGFIGQALYKELCGYFRTFGTYCRDNYAFNKNQHYFQYNIEEDDIFEILDIVKPTIVISAIRGNFSAQIIAHQHITEYIIANNSKLIFLSSANVFDAYSKFPSYENDKTLSHSMYGHFKIKIENMLLRLPKQYYAILRLPMVFGAQSPRIHEIKFHIKEKIPFEVFPNLIMNVTTDTKVTQQIHYLINRNKKGIFHLGSEDLVHHDDFIKEIIASLNIKNPLLKQVYTTNDDRYLAVLSKENKLPKHLQLLSQEILTELEV
ncbi:MULTISPECIES: sugar nucleotide-binding protein [unclassified Olleya]|jgi:dTDP-4-dehydrorhamnose reductase|uniref:sugar nucleotide-binding protein n=1 Tax=unclassified Olleya TaxID=2615019 RepID=UPI0011A60DF5|nr:sugar nucleotide-binding protein [Olleya sp. Hel_I_94]TVZ46623.1 dTDP-4-dehydrorhamnose reductase [Olleya sp. Hel_I_94]|tara:strand:+ start:59449 stop:60279 length:831 start_codon:yes stop_codon:yes gene_type:complete